MHLCVFFCFFFLSIWEKKRHGVLFLFGCLFCCFLLNKTLIIIRQYPKAPAVTVLVVWHCVERRTAAPQNKSTCTLCTKSSVLPCCSNYRVLRAALLCSHSDLHWPYTAHQRHTRENMELWCKTRWQRPHLQWVRDEINGLFYFIGVNWTLRHFPRAGTCKFLLSLVCNNFVWHSFNLAFFHWIEEFGKTQSRWFCIR